MVKLYLDFWYNQTPIGLQAVACCAHNTMPQKRSNQNLINPGLSDSDLDSGPVKIPKNSTNSDTGLDHYIDNTDAIFDLDFFDSFNIIHKCCNDIDKRSLSKYANVIVTAAENMKSLFLDLNNKLVIDSVETKNILAEIKNKLSTPIPYNVIASQKLRPPKEVKPLNNELTLVIKAKQGTSIADINSKVNQELHEIRKKKPNLKINKILRNAKGNVFKLPNTDDLDTLINHFKTIDQLTQIADVYVPKPLGPTIVLRKVSKLTKYDDIPSILANVNDQLNNLQSEIKVLFEFRSNDHSRDVVIRVSPKIFQLISDMDYLYTDIEAIKFHHRVFVRQCKYCFQFNSHKSNECPRKNSPVCADCGTEGNHTCSKVHKCHNCVTYFKDNVQQSLLCHKPNHADCPLYQRQIDRVLQITAFKHVDLPVYSSVSSSPITDMIVEESQQTSSSNNIQIQ